MSKKRKFVVHVQEIYVQSYEVKALNERDARIRVAEGEGDAKGARYHLETLHFDNWSVEEMK